MVIFPLAPGQNSLNCCRVHENVVQKFKLKRQEMTGETRMSLAVVGRKRQTVQTARHLAECSRKWRLRRETSELYGIYYRSGCEFTADQGLNISPATLIAPCLSTGFNL